MKITINGEAHDARTGATVLDVLRSLNFPTDSIVVERNGDILRPPVFETTILTEGDVLELVRFVGGG